MGDFLIAVKTRTIVSHDEAADIVPEEKKIIDSQQALRTINTPDEALEALRSKPDKWQLGRALQFLERKNINFNIKLPGPKAALLIDVLVNTIIPDYWTPLDDESNTPQTGHTSEHGWQQQSLLACLRSVAGLGAILARLRSLITASRDGVDKTASLGASLGLANNMKSLLDILRKILEPDSFLTHIWIDINNPALKPVQRTLLWKELMSLLASGKIPSMSAEASDILQEKSDKIVEDIWIASSKKYSVWLGHNIAHLASMTGVEDEGRWASLAQLLAKSYSLGYTDSIIQVVYSTMLLAEVDRWAQLRALLGHFLAHQRKTFLYSVLHTMPKNVMHMKEPPNDGGDLETDPAIDRGAALITGIIKDSSDLTDALVTWLTGASGGGIGQDVRVCRAALAALSSDLEALRVVLDKSMRTVGDELYIKHTPILHQEAITRVLLLTAGYVHRSNQAYLSTLARSSVYLNAISHRLAASSPRARFLGMITGLAISDLVDSPDKKMKFDIDEMNSADAHWYRGLTRIRDSIGSVEDLEMTGSEHLTPPTASDTTPKTKPHKIGVVRERPAASEVTSKIISIEEVDEEHETEGDDLVAYEKPDSDEEDEDEDPTLVQRNKPTAPAYILDLIAGLRDTDNYDRQRLALLNAAPLIRRKASFGTEVSENVEELATLLVGLSDKFEMENFQELRLQGMIAVLVAQPLQMAKWFSKTFFEGDYSLAQRASILTTLGMGARELAGFKEQDAALTGANAASKPNFPSKMLPDKLHKAYTAVASPVDRTVKDLEKLMIQPMAVEAADKLTGPNALKVRTFSSRMEVERKRKKVVPNGLAKLVAEAFFFPLTGRWWIHLQAYGTRTIQFSPILLTAFLKTLSLILHASGTSTLSLPQMTSEFWDLLLSLRSASADDSTVLEALLFSFLTILEVNEDKRSIAQDNSKELLETQDWAQLVFERARGGDEEGERVRMLAASVLVRTRDVVEKHQRLLLGDMFDF